MSPPLLWSAALIIGLALASVAVATALVVSLPPTYFLDGPTPGGRREPVPVVRWAVRVVKNVLGAFLLVAGSLMLFTPGQGVLTVLLGLLLLDLPGKRALERRLVSLPRVHQALNRLRARFGRPPLILEQTRGNLSQEENATTGRPP
jgi:hypothetical protein